MSKAVLAIMARYPERGKVKTRLAQTIGLEATFQLYTSFLRDLATRFSGQDYELLWAYTPPESDFQTFMYTLIEDVASKVAMHAIPQRGLDFGKRLHQVFLSAAERHFARTILIGSDSPQITRELIAQADQGLATADVVLGPADDGGYYLIAMREPHDLFSGIPMSTAVVLAMTMEKAQQRGLRVQLLETLFDIDTQADLQRLANILQRELLLAPHTAACLNDLKKRGLLL